MIVIAGTIPVKAERWNEAQALAAKMVEETLKEPGCISYQFHTAATADNTFFLFEEWESEEALAAHFRPSIYKISSKKLRACWREH